MASAFETISSESGIRRTFAECRAGNRAALVVYATAGHPSPEAGLDVLRALADEGADLIELGIPFSDPLADGPVIQLSSFDALRQGVDLAWALELLARFRAERQTPVVLFSYLNPIMNYGVERFVADATAAGADGVLVTDLPVGTDPGLEGLLLDSPLDLIRLVAPTTPADRIRRIAADAQGFIYYISRLGVTGKRAELTEKLADEVQAVRARSELPVAVGFGISTPQHAAEVARIADGVVVGSALVDRLARGGVAAGAGFVSELRRAIERAAG